MRKHKQSYLLFITEFQSLWSLPFHFSYINLDKGYGWQKVSEPTETDWSSQGTRRRKSVKSHITYLILPNQFGWLGTCFAKYKLSFMRSTIMLLTLTLLQILHNAVMLHMLKNKSHDRDCDTHNTTNHLLRRLNWFNLLWYKLLVLFNN